MITINALKIRQKFGSILNTLKKSGEPIIVEKGRKPVAVLISIETFEKRFVDYYDLQKRKELLNEFKNSSVKAKEDSLKVLREYRYG